MSIKYSCQRILRNNAPSMRFFGCKSKTPDSADKSLPVIATGLDVVMDKICNIMKALGNGPVSNVFHVHCEQPLWKAVTKLKNFDISGCTNDADKLKFIQSRKEYSAVHFVDFGDQSSIPMRPAAYHLVVYTAPQLGVKLEVPIERMLGSLIDGGHLVLALPRDGWKKLDMQKVLIDKYNNNEMDLKIVQSVAYHDDNGSNMSYTIAVLQQK